MRVDRNDGMGERQRLVVKTACDKGQSRKVGYGERAQLSAHALQALPLGPFLPHLKRSFAWRLWQHIGASLGGR